ncbi:MAG: hypothetical protein FJ303_27400 [Planctomycetes bacterium]|nr:hypothetical protein [Planctomycetota bacterium]
MTNIRASIVVLALAFVAALLDASAPVPSGGDLKKTVKEIAAQFQKAHKEKGDAKAAKELAEKTGKGIEKTIDLMAMFRLREKEGLGVGAKPGPNSARDGIEAMTRELSRSVPPAVLKDIGALEEMGYVIAAMGAIVDAKGPPKGADKKATKLWHEYAHDTHVTGLAFAKVAATKNAAAIKTAALKVNIACGGCHAFFR